VVVVNADGAQTIESFEREEDARAVVRAAQRELAGEITIADALDKFELWLESTGAKRVTVLTARERLDRFFRGETDAQLGRLTPARAAAIYDRLRERYAVQTHRHTLAEAKRFVRWCVEQKLLRSNPVADLKPLGRPRRGKPQLRVDEARALLDKIWAAFEGGDSRALIPAICLLTGLRAGEVARMEARDVDDRGRLLWVPESKTDAGRRVLEVPAPLQARLVAQAAGRVGQLFPDLNRHSVHYHCDRMCVAAGVPAVGPHGLRGTFATLSTRGGTSPEALMRALGRPRADLNGGRPAALHRPGRDAGRHGAGRLEGHRWGRSVKAQSMARHAAERRSGTLSSEAALGNSCPPRVSHAVSSNLSGEKR
jgi:integrase